VSEWNYADVWELIAEERPGAPALVQGGRRLSWGEWSARADALAAHLLGAGLGHQAKVAQYLPNRPEYLESLFACFKAGLVPVNTNYRYGDDELAYLWDNADVEAVVLDRAFLPRAAAVRPRVPGVRCWLVVGASGGEELPGWATDYDQVVASNVPAGVRGPWGRGGDDIVMIYTGGTTGLPKGVMWRQDDLFCLFNAKAVLRYPLERGLAGVREVLQAPGRYPPPVHLPGPPLMHGTGMLTALSALASAGSVVMPPGGRFDPVEVLDTASAEAVTEMSIVGDAFARPLLAALDAEPGRFELGSLWLIVSSGVMWSAEVKAGLARHLPKVLMVDTLGSSEALSVATSRSRAGETAATAGFVLGPDTRVITEDGADVVAGSGERGLLALRGRGPIGYYKDPEKTAATFRTIGGERWSIPGDWAEVAADGTLKLLGRGSVVINTGGEKVFPEEVEEALKAHPGVDDAVVVGLPDERFGAVVTALVVASGRGPVPERELTDWVKARLAGFKAPRHVLWVASLGRAPNGKADYARLRAEAAAALGVDI